MKAKRKTISAQEANLRIKLGALGPWEKLNEKTRKFLNTEYNKIILSSLLALSAYDSELADIRKSLFRINSINPFESDLASIANKRDALDRATSLLRTHGIPCPLPEAGEGLKQLRKNWFSLRSKRRRAIRTAKCKELSLPANSSWQTVLKEEARLLALSVTRNQEPNASSFCLDADADAAAASRTNTGIDSTRGSVFLVRNAISMVDVRFTLSKKAEKARTLEEASILKEEIVKTLARVTVDKPCAGYQAGDIYCGKVLITRSQRDRLLMNLKLCNQVIQKLSEGERLAKISVRQYQRPGGHTQRSRAFSQGEADATLLANLNARLSKVESSSGFIYLRRWRLPNELTWYKIGITNNPERREAEQNVLPVPAETIVCTNVGSMERARSLEAALHSALFEMRIQNASNRELFHLNDSQLNSVISAIASLTG